TDTLTPAVAADGSMLAAAPASAATAIADLRRVFITVSWTLRGDRDGEMPPQAPKALEEVLCCAETARKGPLTACATNFTAERSALRLITRSHRFISIVEAT